MKKMEKNFFKQN